MQYSARMERRVGVLLKDLGRRVRTLREASGLSRRALSQASGVSERYLADLEAGRGNISVGRLAEVAWALGRSPRDLLPAMGPGRVVALLGLRGAGKSTLGREVAGRLGLPFVELDAEIAKAAGMGLGELFEIHGEAYYRRLEVEVLERVLERPGPFLLATGGGIVTNAPAFERLLERCTTVWLRAEPEDHWNRVLAQGDRRPMQDHPEAMAQLRRLLEARSPRYARADHHVDTSTLGWSGALEALHAIARGVVGAAGTREAPVPPA